MRTYVYENQYGIGTRDDKGDRIGHVAVFVNKQYANAYVLCKLDKREVVDAKTARREIERMLRGLYWTNAELRKMPIDELLVNYAQYC